MAILIDPPSGWQHGFPKPLPQHLIQSSDEELSAWLLEQGYPQKLLDQGMLKYCRFIEMDENG